MFIARRLGLTPLVILSFLGSTTASFAQNSQPPAMPPAQHQHPAEGDRVELFPARETSGTAWQPDASAMHGVHRTWGNWDVMLHGNVFAQFLYEPGDRHRTGGSANRQMSSVNWGMGMARRFVGAGR